MAITQISRDYGIVPSIVRILTTDSLAVVSAAGYITAQLANITAINNGPFTWQTSDFVAVAASDGGALFNITSDFASLSYLSSSPMVSTQVSISAAQFNGMYAAPLLLVAAPGVGKLILVSNMALAMTYGSAQFTGGGATAAQYEATVHGAGVLATATVAGATIDALTASTVLNFAGAGSVVHAAAVNEPLYLSNDTAAFATGDSTFIATINYSIINA